MVEKTQRSKTQRTSSYKQRCFPGEVCSVLAEMLDETTTTVSKMVMEHVEGQLDVINGNIHGWPPIDGMSATEGTTTIRNLIPERCFSRNHIDRLEAPLVEILRARVANMIVDAMRKLKESVSDIASVTESTHLQVSES